MNVMNYYLFSYYFPTTNYIQKLFISNNGKPTTNYKSMHFIMNNKEWNEEEIQNYILSDPNNETMNLFPSTNVWKVNDFLIIVLLTFV